MKNIKLISILLFTFLVFSCKKDKIDSKTLGTTAEFYLNKSSNEDGLLIEVRNAEGIVYYYGTSNSDGKIDKIKSIAFKQNNISDTIINFILDEQKRPYIVYLSNSKDNKKYDHVTKISYLNNDSIKLSLYKYDWATAQDSLIAEYVGDSTNMNQTYGNARISDELDDQLKKQADEIVKGFMGVGAQMVVAAFTATIFVAAGFVGVPVAIATIITTGVFMIDFANASTPITYITTPNTKAPTSPTATNTTIPNPIGTPEDPTGNIPNYGTGPEGYGGTAIWNRNGYIQELDQISCFNSGAPNHIFVNDNGIELMTISLGNLGSIQNIPRRTGTYVIGEGDPIVRLYASAMLCTGEDDGTGTITVSKNSFILDWKAPNPSGINSNCPEEGVIWHISGSWQ